MRAWPATGVFRHKDFLKLWGAQIVSALGSRVTRTALPIMAVLAIDASPMALGLLAALTVGPSVLVALVAGGPVDRSRKRPILVAADLVRGAAVLSIPVCYWAGVLSMVQLYAVGAVVGAGTALFQIADRAYLPALVGRGLVVQGNSVLEASEAVAEIAGPGVGGGLIQLLGAPVAVLADAASYLWSALWLGAIHKTERPAAAPEDTPSVRRDLVVGFRASWDHPLVRPLLLSTAGATLFGGFFGALYILFTLHTLGLSPGTIGVIISMGGVGGLFGAVGSGRLVRRLGLGRGLLLSLLIGEAAGMLIPAASGPRWLVVSLLCTHQLLGDGFGSVFMVQAVSLRQTVLPLSVLGRSNAAFQAVTGAALPLGALAAGAIAHFIGVRNALWLGMGLGTVAPVFLVPLRGLERMPAPHDDDDPDDDPDPATEPPPA